MLSRIDEIIYPNRCEVIEFSDPQRFVYPIFKNGHSSLHEFAGSNKLKILLNEQIKNVKKIEIVLREPQERFISGVNTFVFNTKRDNPNLDINTIIYFVENYLFLNRHYAPQLSWLVNLSRYSDAEFNLHHMDYITHLTNINVKPKDEQKILSEEIILRLKNNPHVEIYHRLDLILLDLVDKTLRFPEIIQYLELKDPIAYSKLKCTALD